MFFSAKAYLWSILAVRQTELFGSFGREKRWLSRLLPVGGAALDEAIVGSVRHNKEVSDRTDYSRTAQMGSAVF